VFTTHLASGSDLANLPCGVPALPGPPFTPPSPPCPAECVAFVDTVRECQAKQMALFVEDRHDVPNPALATGDFNTEPGSVAYQIFTDRGWIDSHLAGGNGECNPVTGENCTSGRSEVGGDLELPDLNVDRRIDYIFVVPAEPGAQCGGGIEPTRPGARFNKVKTGLFAAVPNPFTKKNADCGPEPDAICWTSDHSGNIATLDCEAGE
jgi:hypothetical protein